MTAKYVVEWMCWHPPSRNLPQPPEGLASTRTSLPSSPGRTIPLDSDYAATMSRRQLVALAEADTRRRLSVTLQSGSGLRCWDSDRATQ
jgi:hypothetical protein